MPDIYEGTQSCMFKRVLNTPLQLYLFHLLSLKKREGKPYQYQSVQRFFSEYTYVKRIPDSLHLSQKQTKLNRTLTKIFFRLNIFSTYFQLKLLFFTVHICLFLLDLSLFIKIIVAFIKKLVDYFHKHAIKY